LTLVGFVGLLGLALNASQYPGINKQASVAGVGIVVAGAALLIGGLFGFLFGLPHIKMQHLGEHLAPGLGGKESATFAMGLCVYFVLCGFLIGFLWTRLYLQRAMRESDVLAETLGKAKEAMEACRVVAQDAQEDAKVSALVSRQLSIGPGVAAVNEKELNDRIKETTGTNRARIFYEAARVRSNNWSANKPLMERTIPIFKALIATESEKNLHPEYHGELGFALKDKEHPDNKEALEDYKEALEQLETAIRMRQKLNITEGQAWYEFLRAVCRIQLDKNFAQKQRSDDATKKLIVEDLKAAQGSGLGEAIGREGAACEWIQLNKVEHEFTDLVNSLCRGGSKGLTVPPVQA
jgi:hypothetical protein